MSGREADWYTLIWQAETDAAICVREFDAGEDIWLPKSQIDYDLGAQRGDEVEVEIPEWLAVKKALV